MAITISGNGISSDAIASLAATKLTGQVPDANAPSGSVVQVVNTQNTSAFTTSGSLLTVAELSITPSNTNNKIFISWFTGMADNLANSNDFFIYLKRGGSGGTTLPVQNATRTGYLWSASRVQIPVGGVYLDSPSSNSALTYGIYIQPNTGSCNFSGMSLTAMEIAA